MYTSNLAGRLRTRLMACMALIAVLVALTGVTSSGASETAGVLYLCQDTGGTLAIVADPQECGGTVYEIEGQLWTVPTATPTMTATATASPSPTATATPVPPTATATSTPQACSVPSGASVWHTPTDHEHGDAPPAWADTWSCQQYGYPVVFGGDEATAGENATHMGHVAFKGWSFVKEGVSLFVRLHIHSNPHGRSTEWHSYEVFARDTTGAVSHWQGWLPFGEHVEGGGVTRGNQLATAGVPHFITGASTLTQDEQWYIGNKFGPSPWGWDFVVNITNPTTLYNAGEDATPHDMTTWEPTGMLGTSRTLVHAMYYIDGDAGSRYPWRNNPGLRGWFCATPQGVITTTGSQLCPSGSLPQHVAPTMPALESVLTINRTFTCPGCQLPN